MDTWTPQQVELMKHGGNDRCTEFLKLHGVTIALHPTGEREMIRQKYDSPAAELYKQVLKAEVEGKPIPTELPQHRPTVAPDTTATIRPRRMEGFGSTHSPPETLHPPITGKKILLFAVPAVAVAALWLLVPH